MDLSYNDFERISTPSINTSLVAHNHLPANFSMLYNLDLSYNLHLRIDDLHWLSRLPSLAYFGLRGTHHLPSETNWVRSLTLLPLEELHLYDYNLNTSILSLEYANFSSLKSLDLGLNDFRDGLPNWLFNLSKDNFNDLYLSQCNLGGQIPDFSGYQNLQGLYLSDNKLKGSIPDWLGQVDRLYDLDLSDNLLHGCIPSNLVNASNLEVLNISFNDLSGTLPKNIVQRHFVLLDLSHNSISGDISNRRDIPEQIEKMKDIESLDFSHNNLHGNIPQSMAGLSFLSVLNMSYNHFSGQTLLGTQLQSFDAWSYTGNTELCGAPLPNNCTLLEKLDNTKQVGGNDNNGFLSSLYLGMGVGFAMGFWVVCGSLFLNREWRHTYLQFFYDVVYGIYVAMAIKL
ncbi:LRR receptor-like serine/threonine-protein kinase GSO1 [Prosopis cineraria]|uniref:LRR receptor-like serine/threonine-protein kinase GSO1 n=1 Tax=Prosopis cineraria TaxID=364024 RepID=UPI00240F628C|nr:LRR receptor-like serine/threonine-protein kinase GSO1 [Prosopis cineraria]